jgi:hypothetical protein
MFQLLNYTCFYLKITKSGPKSMGSSEPEKLELGPVEPFGNGRKWPRPDRWRTHTHAPPYTPLLAENVEAEGMHAAQLYITAESHCLRFFLIISGRNGSGNYKK